MISTLQDLFQEHNYLMHPSVFEGMRKAILENISGHVPTGIVPETKLQGMLVVKDGKVTVPAEQTSVFMGDADYMDRKGYLDDRDSVINIVRLHGAMTRYGGECSYGSYDLRDKMMRSADIRQTVGHIIHCHTPGGMASSLRDWRKAIDYAHSKGQKVYMFCDGDVFSGGAFLAAMCDGVYFYNPEDSIGSLGMYSAFFSLADGAVNSITGEKYNEYYAAKSPDKNRWYREVTNDNDRKRWEAEVDSDLTALLATVKADRPSITEEQLKGGEFRMSEVIGTLVDGQTTLTDLAQKIYEEWNVGGKGKGQDIPKPMGDNDDNGDGDGLDNDDDNVKGGKKNSSAASSKGNNPKNSNKMSKKYAMIASLLGLATIESDKANDLCLQEDLADQLESALEKQSQTGSTLMEELAGLRQKIEAKDAEVELLAQQLAESQTAKEALQQAVDAEKANVTRLEGELQTAKDENTSTAAAHAEEVKTLQDAISGHEQTITDLNAQVEELNQSSGKGVNAGGSPADNGSGLKNLQMSTPPVYDPNLSPGQNQKAMEEYNAELRRMAYKQ